MALNTQANRDALTKQGFSQLETDEAFEVTSPCDRFYNCIAWAMGFDDRWVDDYPDTPSKRKWWPSGVVKDHTPKGLISAFEAVGFECCESPEMEEGYDKVVLYKSSKHIDPNTGLNVPEQWTHAARVIGDNLYHSKMGESFDIHHSGNNVFSQSPYGIEYQSMRRRIEDRSIIDDIVAQESSISIPRDINNLIALMMKGGL